MKVTQIVPGRFHHFHLARQLERFEIFDKIYTAYPRFKLKEENGIPSNKIITFPWIHTLYMKRNLVGIDQIPYLDRYLFWLGIQSLDKYVASHIKTKGILIALSCSGLYSGKKMHSLGGKFICDRGSSHIVFQNEILEDEYNRFGFKWKGIDERVMAKELEEYEECDFVTIPSEFVKKSFLDKGVKEEKLMKIPYGARLDRFKKIGEPTKNKFTVLWVGGVSLRKGFMYALNAFNAFKHPNKEFVVIGHLTTEIKQLMHNTKTEGVLLKGNVPNAELLEYYSKADVFLLTSLEEGLAMVQGEALACGCPIIATPNTGSEDLITSGKEGFIVPIRNEKEILDSFYKFSDTPHLREEMSENALLKVKSLGGWDTYGSNFNSFIKTIQ